METGSPAEPGTLRGAAHSRCLGIKGHNSGRRVKNRKANPDNSLAKCQSECHFSTDSAVPGRAACLPPGLHAAAPAGSPSHLFPLKFPPPRSPSCPRARRSRSATRRRNVKTSSASFPERKQRKRMKGAEGKGSNEASPQMTRHFLRENTGETLRRRLWAAIKRSGSPRTRSL